MSQFRADEGRTRSRSWSESMPMARWKTSRSKMSRSPRPSCRTFRVPKRQRAESITDISFADGRVFVAGLSNEEFSSRLIAIPFPFSTDGFDAAAIEIYHGAHGRFETKSPIRTFVTYRINNEPYMLAAYQCTPLVKLPVADLKAGAHVKGTTIAELGNRNRPLDMIVYQKDGKDYLLMTNSSRGVMKIPTEGAGYGGEHHRAGPRRRHQGAGLRDDRRYQRRGSDGPARQPSRRAAGARKPQRHDGPQDDRIAVIFREWLKLKAMILVMAGANSFARGIGPGQRGCAAGSHCNGRGRRRSTRDRPAPVVEAAGGSSSKSRR